MGPKQRIDATSPRRRLDAEVVRRGLADSRDAARALIGQNRVIVGGSVASNPERMVAAGEPIEFLDPPPTYVSRGGLKLERALSAFNVNPAGQRCLDAGSSTGGFTDALLQHGATAVVAVDVGTHQLHERLRADDRVVLYEQTDIRALDTTAVGGRFAVVVADLSFISIRSVIRELLANLADRGDLVILVKPQFEAQRDEANRGRGIISDPAVWRRTLLEVHGACLDAGAALVGLIDSPIRGGTTGKGNVEFLAHMRHASAVDEQSSRSDVGVSLIDRVIEEHDPALELDSTPQPGKVQQESS